MLLLILTTLKEGNTEIMINNSIAWSLDKGKTFQSAVNLIPHVSVQGGTIIQPL